jgi:formate dehydrogenase gamma subunit
MAESEYVQRFSRPERGLHWANAVAFFGMLVTGVALYLPSVAGAFGSRGAVKTVHLAMAAAWICVLLVVVATSDRAALRRTAREIEQLGAVDVRWLTGRGAPQGRFNAGQKAHAILQAAFAVLFTTSGLLLWLGERETSLRLPGTIVLHDGLTLLASVLVAGHLFLALAWPTTRPALRGMLQGAVRRDWAAEHHARWVPLSQPTQDAPAAWASPGTWALLALAAAVAVIAAVQLT